MSKTCLSPSPEQFSDKLLFTVIHAAILSINNVFDAFYYEKLGYPLQGGSFKLSYRLGF